LKHLLEGFVGAIFGAVLFMVIVFYTDSEPNWDFAYVLMGICFIMGAALGERFLEWIKNVIQHVW
jgi:CDP-diglyceride synthetase